MEIWKDIEDYEGFYQISNFGRVKSLRKLKILHDRFCYSKEKIIKNVDNGRGYKTVCLSKNNKQKENIFIY